MSEYFHKIGRSIGTGVTAIGNRAGSRSWTPQISVEYSSRSSLDLLETGSGLSLNAKIIPSVGKIDANNYLTRSYTNFEVGDSSGYVEISWYHDGQSGIKDLFATGSTAATQRYFRIYTSNNVFYCDIRSNISTVFRNRFFVTSAISTGWHVIRIISNGSAYSAVLDGGGTLTVGSGLTISDGSNDGRWLNFVPTRNTLEMGAYTDSSGITKSGTEFYLRYVDYNNKHKWYTHGQGNKVFDTIGTDNFTWTGATHQAFNISADTTLLTGGYSIWGAYGQPDEYVPYKAGNPNDVSAFLTGYTKRSDHAGSANTYNLAPSLVDFDYADASPALLAVLNRGSVTYQSAASRAATYYDASNTYRYHSSELANPTIYNLYFNAGYRGMYFAKITTTTTANNYYPVSISNIYLSSTDGKGSGQYNFMVTCGSHVFAAVNRALDADGYLLTKLTDVKHFGASPSATPELTFAAVQKAVDYAYNNTLTFGSASETYTISQPIYLQSYKTYTINSTIKIKDATITRLTQNYVAGENHIHVVSTAGFNVGEWVGMRDSDSTYNYELWWGWNTWITAVDHDAKTITFNSTEAAASIWNYATAKDAWVGHAQSVFIAENKTNITFTGTGLIDTNQANQAPINGLLPGSVFEELRSTSGFAGWVSDNITITNLRFINGLRHNICITGTGATAALRCDGVTIQNVTSTFAHNKNCNIRYCDTVLIEDYIGNDALREDGLMFYLGNTNVIVNRIECKRNGRWGLCWNGATGTGIVVNDVVTDGNVYGGVAITAASATMTDLVMGDRLVISNQYDNCNNITMSNVAISNYTPSGGLYNNAIVGFLGEITNIEINELSITDCNGLGIYSTNQFTPPNPPVNVDIIGGGFYNHTGTKASLYAGSDMVFTDFDNYP